VNFASELSYRYSMRRHITTNRAASAFLAGGGRIVYHLNGGKHVKWPALYATSIDDDALTSRRSAVSGSTISPVRFVLRVRNGDSSGLHRVMANRSG
jgi:hypothetical protein